MNDSERLNPGHSSMRAVLRIVGPLMALGGLIMTAIGMISFFSAFGSFEPPRYFWCAFVGLPMLAIGIGICKFAFLGSIVRYMAGETAPVGKDTFNYMAEGTKEGVRTMASSLGEGLASGFEKGRAGKYCTQCGEGNSADARFCSNCGSRMPETE